MRVHQLESHLRSLRLFGMLETLEVRLAQASAGELGYVELVEVLCQDEATRRDAAGLERRLRAAHFEQAASIEDFDFSYNPKIPAAQIRDLATLRFVEAGESVILHGPVGVGKSMVAQALGHAACRRGHGVVFTKTSRLLADLAGGHADHSFSTRLRRWAKPPCSSSTTSRCATSHSPRPTTSTSSSPTGPERAMFSRQTDRRRTGIRCSRTRSSPSRSSTGS